MIFSTSEMKMERLNPSLKQAEPPITKKKKMINLKTNVQIQNPKSAFGLPTRGEKITGLTHEETDRTFL